MNKKREVPKRVKEIQELRRSSAASPVKRDKTRKERKRLAITEQEKE